MDKSINDVFNIGRKLLFRKQECVLSEVMIVGTSEMLYTVFRFSTDNSNFFFGYDIETNALFPLASNSKQVELYNKILNIYKRRLYRGDTVREFNYKSYDLIENYNLILQGIVSLNHVKYFVSKLSIGANDYKINWYSYYCDKKGDALIVSISEKEMINWMAKQALYEEVFFTISMPEYDLKYQANIVRIEKYETEYLLYILPYPMEVLQTTQCKSASFENFRNPFSIMDFIVNHSDSDVNGVVYPHSEEKPIHNYIVVGVIKNIAIGITDCVIGNVRIGIQIEVSSKFMESISNLSEECTTIAWVNVKSDSLYHAFSTGKKLLNVAVSFLSFMIKNDMYTDWFGTVESHNTVWDIRSHNPHIELFSAFYIEDCISRESVTLTDENMKIPTAIKLDENAEYLFEYDWIEKFFHKLQIENKKVLRLQYALNWIVQAWNAEDPYDRVIYCSTALEFIVNGEKGLNIFDEYAYKVNGTSFSKKERNDLINEIIENIKFKEIDDFTEHDVKELNDSIKRMVQSKLTDTSFNSKLDGLINRLNIPTSESEMLLLQRARKIRNELIHGLQMSSISSLEIKKLCGIISRILMYKIMDELEKE